MSIEDEYNRLARETQRPCYSITFWRTVSQNWGARAGLGDAVFGHTLAHAIEAAVSAGIEAQQGREREADPVDKSAVL